jgi:hypothetical protein
MVHLSDVIPEGTSMPGGLTEAEQQEDGFAVHAGLWETSSMMFLHPELVSPAVREAVPQTGQNWNDLVRLARAPEWPGYFGSPRLATAAQGARLWQRAGSYIELALRILDGLDERQIPRLSDVMSKSEPNLAIDRDAVERERHVEQQQQAWLKKHVTR